MFYTLILLFTGIIVLFFIYNNTYARWYALYISLLAFFQTAYLIFNSNGAVAIELLPGIYSNQNGFILDELIISELSRGLVLLTVFIMPLIISSLWENTSFKTINIALISLLAIELFLIISFLTIDLLIFYVAFESLLIPMVVSIAVFGGRTQKIKALYYLFFYTLVGSIFLLVSLMFLLTDATLFDISNFNLNALTGDGASWLSLEAQNTLWLPFFIAFSVKMPSFPFHIWLPAAHVEAPTFGSVILAALVLKLGGYGILQFMVPVFTNQLIIAKYWPVIVLCGVTSIIFASLIAARQVDAKRIIAYSSIAHMNLGLLGMFSNTFEGVVGSYHLMIAHGFVSAAMFFLIGVIYDRAHSRLVEHYSGLVSTMPIFSTLFLIATFANIGFPGTYNFIGEFVTLLGLFKHQFVIGFLAALGTIGAAIYSILLLNKLVYGYMNTQRLQFILDIEVNEFFIQFILLFLTILYGINVL